MNNPNISIDSRTIKPGDLFIALKGEQFDGHDFVKDALNNGASGALVERDVGIDNPLIIKVKSTLEALHDLARNHLQTMPGVKIALTGSNGKTTTKEMIRSVFSNLVGVDAVFASAGNKNNHIGLPLQALATTKEHKVLIFEMGTNHFGEIEALANIVRPSIALITNIGNAHTEFLIDKEGVAKAKAEIYTFITPHDIAIFNADDALCFSTVENLSCKKYSFGTSLHATVRLIETVADVKKHTQTITLSFEGKTIATQLNFLGEHNAINACAAVCVAVAAGYDFQQATQSLITCVPVKGRMAFYELADGITLLDDSYNANPQSMDAGLKVLASFGNRRKIAILGSMGELGALSSQHHKNLGKLCAERAIDCVVSCGEGGKEILKGAWEAGIDSSNLHHASTSAGIAETIHTLISDNDVIFVKGSLSAQMGTVVEKILASHPKFPSPTQAGEGNLGDR